MSERHGRLVGIKLRALVGDHLGRAIDVEPQSFPPGAALLIGRSAWVLLESEPERRLGAALAWAIRHDADELHVVAESGTGALARRAAEFTIPISVWHAEGRLLLPAIAEPVVAPGAADADHLRFNDLMRGSWGDARRRARCRLRRGEGPRSVPCRRRSGHRFDPPRGGCRTARPRSVPADPRRRPSGRGARPRRGGGPRSTATSMSRSIR